MPVKPFKDLFMSWAENQDLYWPKLRLKCVTCLALILTLRPSDMGTKAVYLDSDECMRPIGDKPLFLSLNKFKVNMQDYHH